jgi:predicted ferric reductase
MVTFLHRWQLSSFLSRTKWLRRISWTELLLQLLYWAGILACNIVGVRELAGAGTRAGSLAVLHFTFLLAGSRLHLVADLIDIPLDIFIQMHKVAGWMATLQAGIHIFITGRTTGIKWNREGHRDGIIVS